MKDQMIDKAALVILIVFVFYMAWLAIKNREKKP